SYQFAARSFPEEIAVWDSTGKLEYKVASLPLANRVPIGGVRTGPRSVEWVQSKPAEISWVEALDGGNPRETVPNRDRIVALAAPFRMKPTEIALVKERFRELQPLANDRALVEDFERKSRVIRTLLIDFDKPGAEPRVIFSRNERDAYHNPGSPVIRIMP